MANTAPLGAIWKPSAWRDAEPVPRVTLPDGTNAEAVAGLLYGWNGTAFQRVTVDGTGAINTVGGGGGSAVTVADGADVAQGATTDASTALTVIGRLKKLLTLLPAALGATTSANSLAVVLASDQAAVPVSGTVTANAGTGTLAVSAAALPLPTGAATAAKQPALGTAGTSSADVLTVQGRAAMTALLVDGSAVTQPVSGTITANVGSGTQPVSGTVTANAGTGTLAVSAASLPLPAGAATAAKQPALGTAGTANADVITVQGIASMTAVKVDGSAVTQPVSGTVTANAGTGTLAVSLASLPALAAGTNLAGRVSASVETSTIYNATTALTPKFANLTASSSGITTLIALVGGKKLRVLSLSLIATAAVDAKFQSSVIPTDISGLYYLAANGGFVLPFNPTGWFETVSGEALTINLSAAVAVGGNIVYVEV